MNIDFPSAEKLSKILILPNAATFQRPVKSLCRLER